jgi:hypothetical protein
MKKLNAVMYRLGSHRLWWMFFLDAAIVFAVLRETIGGVTSLVLSFPVVVFAYLLLSQRTRWKRDEERERTTGIRRGPFD